MKFIKSLSIFLFLVISLNIQAHHNEQKIIKILSWSDYFDPEVIKTFEKENNVIIQLTTYYEESMRDYLFKNKTAQQFDIIVSSKSGIIDYKNLNLLAPIESAKYNNLKFMDNKFIENEDVNKYSIALSYIGIGIVYRKDKINSLPETWKEFVNPPKEHHGKIELIGSANDVLDISLIANGNDLSNYSFIELREAAKTSLEFNKHVASYNYPSSYEGDTIMEGISSIGMAYSFEAYKMLKKSDKVGFLYPKEGIKIWVDLIAMSKDSHDKEISHKFIDYLMKPSVSAKNAMANLYTSLNTDVKRYMNNEMATSEILYPNEHHKILKDYQNDPYIKGKKIYYFERIRSVK